jgi:ABC-type glycerol-3-phosphate transport system substrate-binding protein
MRKVYYEKYVPYGWIPPRPSILKDPETQKRVPWMKPALEKLMDRKDIYYFELSALPEYFAAIDAAGSALHKAMSGATTVEEGFATAQKEAEALFKKAGYLK